MNKQWGGVDEGWAWVEGGAIECPTLKWGLSSYCISKGSHEGIAVARHALYAMREVSCIVLAPDERWTDEDAGEQYAAFQKVHENSKNVHDIPKRG